MAVAPVTTNLYTTVRNVSGKTLTFGFLPPHGKTLDDNEEYTFAGDIQQYLTSARKVNAFKNAIEDGLLVVGRGADQSQVVYCAVDNTSVIAAGDMVFLDTDDVKSAADFTWDTDLATTQAEFAAKFLGIALAAHASGGGAITDFPVDISHTAVYSLPCTSETHEIGDTLGPAKDSGNALLPQKLVKAAAGNSIASCVKRDGTAATTVSVVFESFANENLLTQGPQGVQGSTGAQGPQGDQGAAGS